MSVLRVGMIWCGLLLAVPVRASVGSCSTGDAPSSHHTEPCRSVCSESGNELVCELETLCVGQGAGATAVTGFGSSSHDVSIWGQCFDGTEFCCVFDDTGDAVTTVELSGTDENDEALSFTHERGTGNERNLQPWDDDDLTCFIRGNAGSDYIYGSNYAGADYDESLYGQVGNDIVQGYAGKDFLSGGNGDDVLNGGGGNDTIWGGDGDDELTGGADDDKLCDASGYNECASVGGNYFNGADGDDKIWYEESEDPNVPCPGVTMDTTSTAGAGSSDQCGDYSNWTISELPNNCESYITTRPALCEGAN